MRGKKFIGFVTELLPPRPGRKFMYLVSNKILDWRGFKTYSVWSHYSCCAKYGKQKTLLEQKNMRRITGIFAEMVENVVCSSVVNRSINVIFFSILQSYTSCYVKSILLQGEKVFYFVEPTEENFSQYEKWVSSARQSEVFFGDMVKNCYKCAVKPGQTMFIPTGTNLY